MMSKCGGEQAQGPKVFFKIKFFNISLFIPYQHFKKPYALIMLPCKMNYLRNGALLDVLSKKKAQNKSTFMNPFS